MTLTAAFVANVKPTTNGVKTYGAGRSGFGLMLRVLPSGTKDWLQSIRIGGKRCNLGLGSYPVVSITEARVRAMENYRTARHGGDPRKQKESESPATPTVRELVEALINQRGLSETTRRDWIYGLG